MTNINFLEIKGYKSIYHAKITFSQLNVLIGSNGSGKSNLLSFFNLLKKIGESKLQQHIALRGGEEKFLHKGIENSKNIYLRLVGNNGRDGLIINLEKGDPGFVFSQEDIIDRGNIIEKLTSLKPESNLKFSNIPQAKEILKLFNSFTTYHFQETGKDSPLNSMSNVDKDIYFLYEKGDNIAAILYAIKNKHQIHYKTIIKTIQSIAPFFSDFYLRPNEEGYLRLQWQDKYSSFIYGASDFSDGTLRFIALSVLLLQPDLPKVIILDEPELGLHPFAISKFAGMVKKAASSGTQVVLATQSADLVNHFEADEIITVDQKNGQSLFKRLNKDYLSQWLEEYSLGELWQKKIIREGNPN